MLLSEIRDSFLAQNMIESQKRGGKAISIDNKIIALFMSEGQQEIQMRLKIIEDTQTISAVLDTNAYNLSADFMEEKIVMCKGLQLSKISIKDFNAIAPETGDPLRYAITKKDGGAILLLHPTPGGSMDVDVAYFIETGFYQPSEAAAQDWGNFSGTVWTGSLKLPREYSKAVVYYILGRLYTDYEQRFEIELNRLSNRHVTSPTVGRTYSIGGFNMPKAYGGTTNNKSDI